MTSSWCIWVSIVSTLCIVSLTNCKKILLDTSLDFYPKKAQRNIVTSQKKAEELLKRYGYLKCASSAKDSEELLLELTLGLIGLEAFSLPKENTCSRQEIKAAVMQFQLTYNMRPTGRLNKETLRVMSETRCGNSDDDDDQIIDISTAENKEKFSDKMTAIKFPKYKSKRIGIRNRHKRRLIYSSSTSSSSEYCRHRRLELLKEFKVKILSRKADSSYHKIKRHLIHRKVIKRSTNGGKSSKRMKNLEIITWRLVRSGYSNQLTIVSQKAALSLAFRMWAEVIPLLFVEDNFSPVKDIDIQIAFGKGRHMNCPNNFDGFGGQLGHAIKFRSTGNSQIHVDDDEYYTVGRNSGTNLIKVAVHEVGHALGLLHTSLTHSIMYAIYSKQMAYQNFELSDEDRRKVQKMYGVCDGSFDIVMDWISKSPKEGIIFNTYFFRKNRYWMYQNRFNRTRYGDPTQIRPKWKGLPNNVDSFAHVWTRNKNKAYFFKGSQYWVFDSKSNAIRKGYPRKIQEDFRAPRGVRKPAIPRKIDAAFFNDKDENLYFFKNDQVYAYAILKGRRGNNVPGFPRKISSMFEAANKSSRPLPSKLDSVYFSYSDSAIYFFKGTKYWKLLGPAYFQRNKNKVTGPLKINSKWKDICDTEIN